MNLTLPWGVYSRLTQERPGQRKAGHPVQRRVSTGWGKRRGITEFVYYSDANVSGSDEDAERPDYDRMLQDVADGKLGGIIGYKIDRITRNTFEFERILKIARAARAVIVDASDDITSETSAGRSMLRRNVDYAATEIERISERVTENKRERSSGGHYHGGGPRPFGFVGGRKGKDGRLKNSGKIGVKHVKQEVELLRDAARRIAWEGETYGDVIGDWHSRTPPVYGATGAPWNTKTLQTILTSHRMVGKRIYREVDPDSGRVTETEVTAKWKPILDERTWNQLRSELRPSDGAKTSRSHYLLSSRVMCGRCHRPLTGCLRRYMKGGEMVGTRTYRCKSMPADKARGACGALSVLAVEVEQIVAAMVLARLERSRDFVARLSPVEDVKNEMAQITERLRFLNSELEDLANIKGLTVREWNSKRTPLVEEKEMLEKRQVSVRDRLKTPTPMGDDFTDLPGWFKSLTEGQQKRFVLAHVQQVEVLPPGRSGRYFDASRVLEPTFTDLQDLYREVD